MTLPPGNGSFRDGLPGYFFIFNLCQSYRYFSPNDPWSYYDFFLILLANRFKSPYYRLRNTGSGPVVRPVVVEVGWGVVENAPNVGLRKCLQRMQTAVGTDGSFAFLEYFFRASQTQPKVLPGSLRGASVDRGDIGNAGE